MTKKKRNIILAIVIIAVIVIALVLFLMLSPSKSDDEEEPEATEEITEIDEPIIEETDADDDEADKEEDTTGVYPSVCGALSVQGGRLVDQSGEPVQLRGISTHGLSWYPEYVNEECFSELHDWGANVVRLAMYTAESGGYCTGGDQSQLKTLVKNGVQWASDADLYVIVDWHILSDGNPLTYEAEAIDFFDEMSADLAGYDNVLYEICNEPNGSVTWNDIKTYAESVIPVIRANDPDAVIICGTPTWSQDIDQAVADPIQGYDNIMYSLHFYAATHKDDLRARMTAAADADLPVFVTEFGICDASGSGGIDEDSANQWVDAMDQYGISYVAWNLSNKDETSAIISPGVSKTSGFTRDDLSDSGKWVYDMLGAHRDAAASVSSSGSSGSSGSGASSGSGSSSGSSSGGQSKSGGSNVNSGSSAAVLTGNDLSITDSQVNSWQSGSDYYHQYTISFKNVSKQSGSSWKITVTFNEKFQLSDSWNGKFSVSGKTLTIEPADYNGSVPAGGTVEDIGFIVYGDSSLEMTQVK